jgi:hypothetical protein
VRTNGEEEADAPDEGQGQEGMLKPKAKKKRGPAAPVEP